MLLENHSKILIDDWYIVWIVQSTCIPIVRNPFVARRIDKIIIRSRHCVKRFECVPIEKPLWVFSRLVTEHAEYKRMCACGNREAEKPAEIVWVLGDRLVICQMASDDSFSTNRLK